MHGGALSEIKARLAREGSLPFSEFMDMALYGNDGFYQQYGFAGRRGDFVTGPEVGPLFGALIARYVDRKWEQAGRPDPFFVFDVGAGPGTLAKTVIHAKPQCFSALRYVLVEVSDAQRARHGEHLSLEAPENVFGAVVTDVDGTEIIAGQGPLVCSVASIPAVEVDGVVIANELIDNVPFDVAERNADGWHELMVSGVDSFTFSPAPLSAPDSAWLDKQGITNGRVPLHRQALALLSQLTGLVNGGPVLVIDYGADTRVLADRGEWLRTYQQHQRGNDPFVDVGRCDITTDVAFDQLARFKQPVFEMTQADFLRELGIDELVEEGKHIWEERASLGDLQAMFARSRITEAEALLDLNSLGAFRVAEF